jgi:TRAP-type C4-dicarboxylate transport system permease small subunit
VIGKLFDATLRLAAMVLIAALTLVVALGVVSRGIGEPFIWTDELARFLMVWLACVGWMLASRKHSHIRIRFFLDRLPDRLRGAAELVFLVAILAFGALVVRHGWSLVARSGDLEMTTLPISMSVLYLPLVIAGAATVAQALVEAIGVLRGDDLSPPQQAPEEGAPS